MVLLSLAPGARADAWDRRTIVTFSGPVEIPAVHLKDMSVLPAGTYVFKLVDSNSNRHIVQISNDRENKVYATVLAVPDWRLTPTDKTVITFRERPNGEPPAIKEWFYPGDNRGDEFVYPKNQAPAPTLAANTPVPYNTSNSEAAAEPESNPPAEPAAASVMSQPEAQVETPAAAHETEEIAQADTPPPPPNMNTSGSSSSSTSTRPPTASELPKTASPLGWAMMSGFLSLAGALGVRLILQRIGV
jgi:hypothetical protein